MATRWFLEPQPKVDKCLFSLFCDEECQALHIMQKVQVVAFCVFVYATIQSMMFYCAFCMRNRPGTNRGRFEGNGGCSHEFCKASQRRRGGRGRWAVGTRRSKKRVLTQLTHVNPALSDPITPSLFSIIHAIISHAAVYPLSRLVVQYALH